MNLANSKLSLIQSRFGIANNFGAKKATANQTKLTPKVKIWALFDFPRKKRKIVTKKKIAPNINPKLLLLPPTGPSNFSSPRAFDICLI